MPEYSLFMQFFKKYIKHSSKKNKFFLVVTLLTYVFVFSLFILLFLKPASYRLSRKYTMQVPKVLAYKFMANTDNLPHWKPWLREGNNLRFVIDSISSKTMMLITDNKGRRDSFLFGKEEPYVYLNAMERSGEGKIQHEWSFRYINDTVTDVEWNVAGNVDFFYLGARSFIDKTNREMQEKLRYLSDTLRHLKEQRSFRPAGDTVLSFPKYVYREAHVKKSLFYEDLEKNLPELIIYAIRKGWIKNKRHPFFMILDEKPDYIHYRVFYRVDTVPYDLEKSYKADSLHSHHYFVFLYRGEYCLIPYVKNQMETYLEKTGYEQDNHAPVLWEFIKSHALEKNPYNWLTKIYYPVREKKN